MEAWPAIDRRLWRAGCLGAYGAGLNPATTAAIERGYGRWLSVLTDMGLLAGERHPAERLTPDAVRTNIRVLRDVGNTRGTIIGRIEHLRAAVRIMEPARSYAWLHPLKHLIDEGPFPARGRPRKDPLWGWPEIDQRLWHAGLQGGDILTGPRSAPRLQASTLEIVISGYRRWLTFLRAAGLMDEEMRPGARVTPEHVIAYYHDMRKRQRNTSIVARFADLRAALRIMHPDVDFG